VVLTCIMLYVIQSITSNVVPVFACADFPPRPCFIDELIGGSIWLHVHIYLPGICN
jgi:hypothetical protein